MSAEIDLRIAEQLLGYPKDGWIAYVSYDGTCKISKQSKVPCECTTRSFEPTKNWTDAILVLAAVGVTPEQLIREKVVNQNLLKDTK